MIITSEPTMNHLKGRLKKTLRSIHFLALSMSLTACTTINLNVGRGVVLPANTPIVVGPMENHSDTPLANRQVESIALGVLQTKGFRNVVPYPRRQSCEKLLYCPDEGITNAKLISWARHHHFAYVLTGAANEWRYKVGLDGEPVAGVSLELLNVSTGKTAWTSVGSIIGGTRLGLDVVGQTMLNKQLANLIPAN